MKTSFLSLWSALSTASLVPIIGLTGCGAPQPNAATPAPNSTPVSIRKSAPTPIAAPIVQATAKLKVVQSGRSSLPTLPQMMDNSPRPTYIPLPTPKVRPGQTLIISNAPATPVPRENPTLIISNAPVAGTDITPQAAAERGLVWANTKTLIYHRPGTRFFGGTQDGYYISEAQALSRGFRAALR